MRRIEMLAADSTTLQAYLREISKFPKLTHEQERELGRRIQQRSDEDALGTLVEANLRFVVSYARRYRKLGVPFLDLIHEGNLGLLEGARRFDPDRNEAFITHAAWWVRQSIMHLLSDAVGLAALQAQLEPAPAMRELSGELDLVDEEPLVPRGRVTDQVTLAQHATRRVRRDHMVDLAEVLPGFVVHEIDDDMMREALVQQLECAMRELDPRERQVLRLRYGVQGGEALSIAQIAQRLALPRRRVRAIENDAVQKLRRGKSIRSYLN